MRAEYQSELRRYLAHFTPHGGAFAVAAVLLTLNSLVPGAAVVLLERTLDDVLVAGRSDQLLGLCLAFGALYLVAGTLTVARARITKGIAWGVTASLRRELQARYLALSPQQQGTVGQRLSALTHDTDQLQYGVSAIVTAFRNPLTLAVLIATAVALAPRLAPWALLLVPFIVLPTWWAGRRLRRTGELQRDARAELTRIAQEQLLGIRTIQAFGVAESELEAFDAANEADRAIRLRMEVERVLPSALVQTVAAAAIGILLWFGGQQVLAGEMQPGELVGFAVALGLMNRPLGGLSEVWSLMQRSLAALGRVYETLDAVPAIPAEPADSLPLGATEGPAAVAFDGVHLDYGDGPILRDATLEIQAGEVLALVGTSGAGKSSLLRLLWRGRDPDAGEVRIDGVPVTRLTLADLRSRVAVVRQDDVLFGRTVRENVLLGCPDAGDGVLGDALSRAGAMDFVFSLPKGWDTHVDELGQRLSGGERQRLCLARALATGAGVLILDEATNQVDAETERHILETLEGVRGTVTVIVVAHDLGSIRNADRIVVIGEGGVQEVGTHDELLARDGRYAALWEARA